MSRRAALCLGAAAGLGFALDPARTFANAALPAERSAASAGTVPFFGPHQAGIATRSQRHLAMAAFDLTTQRQADFRDLLQAWSGKAAALCQGSSSRLTITFGLGPGIFEQAGVDRFGLASLRPAALVAVPSMPRDRLDPARSNGDLCMQVCANDPQEIDSALQALVGPATGVAKQRWLQRGFGPTGDGNPAHPTPRNLMGFKDGTDNIPRTDGSLMNEEVWVGSEAEPSWMVGGTYLVARRIRMHLDRWNHTSVRQQERAVGRDKRSGAPLGEEHEFDPVNLEAVGPDGKPYIPLHAHVRLAREGQRRILRRGYAFDDGMDPETETRDAGLFFIAFQQDVRQQFIAIQRQLAAHDALHRFLTHTGSAVFACPPGARPGGYVGETLFEAGR